MPFVFEQEIEQPKERFVFEDPEPAFEDPRLYGIPEGAGEPISTITGKPLLTDFGKPKKADVPSGRFVFEEPEEADFIERVKSSWKTGVAQTELGQLRYRQLLGEDTDEINQQIADLKIGMPSPDKIKRGLPERAIKAAAEMLPIQVAGMKKGAKRGLKMGLGFAGVTAIAGQAGPQVALPEEIVTVPAAFAGGYGVGMLSGTLENIGQIEAGLAYDELLDFKDDKGNRVDPVIAKAAAASVGVINGLIEMAQIKLLLKTIPGGEALLRGSINKTLKKAVTSKTLKAIALKHAGRYGTFIAGETGQEVLQESTNILANEIAKDVTNELRGTDLPATTIQEIGNRLVDTAKQSALAFSVMGIPGTVVSGGIEAGKRKATEPTIPTTPETDQQTTLTNIKAALESGEITTDDVANYARSPEAQEDGIADDLNALIAEAKEIAKPPDVAPSAKDILTEGEDVTAKELLTGKALTDEERIEERAKILEEAPKKPAEISAEAFERKITEEERVKAKAEIEPDLNKFFKRAKEIPITPKQKDLLRGLTKEQAQKIAVQWNEIWKAGTETAKQARITEAETFVRERPDLFNLVHGLLMVKPTPAEPKTDVALEPVGVEIPDFKTTGQKVEGTEQYKKFKPEPKEVPKTGTETEKVEVTPEKKEAWEMTPKEWTQESLQPTIEKMKIGETKVLPDKRIIVKSSQDLTYGETYISRSPVKTKMLDPSEIDQLPDKIKNFVERYEAGEKDLPPIYVSELMVNPKTGETFREIRDGHHRYYMAEEVGLEELPAMERVSGLYPEEHEAIVRNALKKGENVPENVLAEYPDLKPQPPKIEKPKPKLPRTEDLEGEGIPEVALKTWKSEFAETYKKSEFSEPERWDEFKAFSKKEYAEGFPISEHFEGWMAKSKPKPKKEKVEVTKEDIETFIKPLHHKYYLEGQNKGIAVEKLNAYGALQINKLVGSKLRANVDMDAVKQYLKEHPTKVEVTKKAGVEVTAEKPKPFNIVQATKKILPDDSDVHLDGEQLSIYPSAVVNSKAINTKISKILTDRQLHASIKSVKIFNPEISEVAEKEKVETKTTPEGKEISVDLTKKEEAAVTPKQQKEYLLAEIDKAIEAELKTEGFGKGIEDAKELLKRRINPLIQSKTTYKFEVPNDGTFEIAGSALFEFQDRVKSTFPSTITSKKFKPKVKARKGVPTAKYNKILGKAAKDLKPADIDRIFKEVADTEARDITGAVLLNPFQNWLLSQDITKAVKDKIRSVAGKDYIEEARVKIETQDIEYARSMVEHTRNEYDYLRSYHSEYKTGEKTLKQIAKETGIKRSGNELAEEASEAKSAYYKAAEHLEKLEKPTGIKEPTRVRDEKAFATKATKPQDTITRKDLRKIFKRMKHIRTGQDSDGNLWFKAEGRPKITIFELDNITGHLNTSAGQIPVGSYLRDTIELKTGGEGHTADISTAYHELHHWLEKQQLLSANDITALNRVIAKDKGISASAVTEEHRAYYVGDNISAWETQKHPRIRRILRKLTDFMNAIYDFAAQAGWVKGRERTAENVLSDIESGRILSEKELAGVNQFAQDVAFSLKKAAKAVTDNPNFVKWFGDTEHHLLAEEDGEPRVMYRGMSQRDFDIGIIDSRKKGSAVAGYFTNLPEGAQEYADRILEGDGVVKEFYVAAENIFDERNLLHLDKFEKEFIEKETGQTIDDLDGEVLTDDKKFIKALKKLGYDAIETEGNYPHTEICPFESTQIKSIYNTGKFGLKEKDMMFQMAGKKAIGAPTGQLAKAQEMLAEGKDKKEVWRETGWLKGVEKEDTWKFEIDDSGAKINSKVLENAFKTPLAGILEHPELYKAYPELKKTLITVFAPKTNQDPQGFLDNDENIFLNIEHFANAKEIILHEVQHSIQFIENFAKGGSLKLFIQKEYDGIAKTERQISSINKKLKAAQGTAEYDKLLDERQKIVDAYQKKEGKHGIGAQERGHQQYKSLAGEIEARDTSARANLTPAQRGQDFNKSKRLFEQTQKIRQSDKYKAEEKIWLASDKSGADLKKRNESSSHKKLYAIEDKIMGMGYNLNQRLIREALAGDESAQDSLIQMPYESQGIPEDQWIITKGKGTSFSVQEQKAFSVKGGKDYSAMFEKYRVKRTTPLVDELIKKTQADFDPVNATPEETKAFFKDIRLIPKRFRSEVMSIKDMKWYHKALETPYVLAKKFISMEKALRTEIRRHESRTKKVFGYYHGDLGDLQKHMQKNPEDLKTFEALIWEWEGHRFSEKEVPTDWYSVIEDVKDDDYGGIRINPEHYTEVRKYLKKQGVKDVIADGFISVRKLLDNVLIEADSTMRSNNIDQSDLKEFRSYIGKAHNYFSHVREGNSYIKIKNKSTGKTIYREHFWEFKERMLSERKRAKTRTETWLNDQIESGKLSGEKSDYIISPARRVTKLPDEVFFQIPVEALSQISTEAGRGLAASRVRYEALRLMKKEGLSEKEAHEKADKTLTADIERHLARAMADVLKTRGWGQHAIQRQNIPGFKKTDTFETLSGYLTGYAGFATKIQAAKEHSKTLRDMDARKTPNAYKYTSEYIRDMLSNADKTDRMVDRLRAMFFVKYLGGVVKSGMVNLTQNVVMAGPVLSQYTKGSHLKLARAMKDVRKGITGKNAWMGKETSYTTLPENEQKALIEGIETGAAQDLYLRELKGDIPGKGWGRYAKKVIDKAGIFMMVAEKFNRASTLLAAYRIAFNEGTLYDGKQTKKNHDLSVRFAKKAVYDSHFLYGKPNLPAGFRGGDFRKVARAAYTFRSFTHNYLDIMVDLMANQGTQGFKVAGRSLMNLLVVGGLTSIPFFKALSEIIQWAQDDEDEDMLTEIRSKMPNKFMQDMVVYGLSGAVGGFDLSGSLSIEIPTKMKEIIGVPYSMYEDSMRTVASVKAGNMYRAVSETPFTPIAMRNAMRGIELYTKGQRTRGGKAINVPGKREPRKITGVEAVKKAALGLQPVEVSSGYKAYRAATKMKRAIADKKRDWADRIANATIKRDLKKVREIKAEIQEWNLAARRDKKLWRLIDINKMVENRLQGKGLRAFPAKMRKEAQARYEAWQ